ncbi:MAG: transposase [Chloroflexi bacterium]|nr:transposase [Chloroflexota bacterium]
MRALTVPDKELVVQALQAEMRRSRQARYDHRLHAVLLVAQDMSCPEVAARLGDAPRTVEYWVRRFLADGLAGLSETERPGRPSRLTTEHLAVINTVLRDTPTAAGLRGQLWDGTLLAAFVAQRFGVPLGVRQCQRLFRQLGFRLRKPRPLLAHADPERQAAHKKPPGLDAG